jgi:hypothetical protein
MTLNAVAALAVIGSFLSAVAGFVLKLMIKSVIQKEISSLYTWMRPKFENTEKRYIEHVERYHATTNRK